MVRKLLRCAWSQKVWFPDLLHMLLHCVENRATALETSNSRAALLDIPNVIRPNGSNSNSYKGCDSTYNLFTILRTLLSHCKPMGKLCRALLLLHGLATLSNQLQSLELFLGGYIETFVKLRMKTWGTFKKYCRWLDEPSVYQYLS